MQTVIRFSYTYWLAELPVVAVNDYPKIVEMFQKDGDTYAGRLHNEEIDMMVKGTVLATDVSLICMMLRRNGRGHNR